MSKRIIKGDELQLFINNNAPVWATSHTLTLTGNTLDIATKDHGNWAASEIGNLTWELTAECLYSDGDYDDMFDYMVAKTRMMIQFAEVANYNPNGLVSTGGEVQAWQPDVMNSKKGYAVVTSLTANANTGENATYSITFTGAGPLTPVIPLNNKIETIMTFSRDDAFLFDLDTQDTPPNYAVTIYNCYTGQPIPIEISGDHVLYRGSTTLTAIPVVITIKGGRIYSMNAEISDYLLIDMETVPDFSWLDLQSTPVRIFFGNHVRNISDGAFNDLPSDGIAGVDKIFEFKTMTPPDYGQAAFGNSATVTYMVCPVGTLQTYEDWIHDYGSIDVYELGSEPSNRSLSQQVSNILGDDYNVVNDMSEQDALDAANEILYGNGE